MQYLSDQELVSVLSNFILRSKSPYTRLADYEQTTLISWNIDTHGLNSRVDIVEIASKCLTVDCVHDLFHLPNLAAHLEIQQEISQFNAMMEKISLPVFLWMNQDSEILELHWQESIRSGHDMKLAEKMFQQSKVMRDSMEKRLHAKFIKDLPPKLIH